MTDVYFKNHIPIPGRPDGAFLWKSFGRDVLGPSIGQGRASSHDQMRDQPHPCPDPPSQGALDDAKSIGYEGLGSWGMAIDEGPG